MGMYDNDVSRSIYLAPSLAQATHAELLQRVAANARALSLRAGQRLRHLPHVPLHLLTLRG